MRLSKHVLFIALFVLIGIPLVAQASPRYQDITIGGTTVALLDTTTFRYTKDPYLDEQFLDVWIKTSGDNGTYTLHHCLFRQHTPEMMLVDKLEYDDAGDVLHPANAPHMVSQWTPIVPETTSETWYRAAQQYAKQNASKLQKEYNERMNPDAKNHRTIFSVIVDSVAL